jgi:hypothetical protein
MKKDVLVKTEGMTTKLNQHTRSLLQGLEGMLWRPSEVRILRCLLALFLDTSTRTILKNIQGGECEQRQPLFQLWLFGNRKVLAEPHHWLLCSLAQDVWLVRLIKVKG